EILQRLGCHVQVIDDVEEISHFPALVINDDLFCTFYALKRFLKMAKRQKQNVRAALRKSILTEHAATTFQGAKVTGESGDSYRAYQCYYLTSLDHNLSLADQSVILPIPHRIIKFRLRANQRFVQGGRYILPVSLVYFLPVEHWACLSAANMLGMFAENIRAAHSRLIQTLFLPLKMICRAGSLRPSSLAGKSYFAGRRCRIHPNAQIYNSVLGDRVCVGAFVTIRNSVIGDCVDIRAGAVVDACTLGDKTIVECNTVSRGCVSDEGAMLAATFMQMSVFGRGAVQCPMTGIADFTGMGTVPVIHEGQRIRSGSKFLGGCLGDDAFIGPTIAVNCGRTLPKGYTIVCHPDYTLSDLDLIPKAMLRTDRGRKLKKDPAQLRKSA
ncbi:MAG: hypothetical protein N2C12_13665, partial [Planctomycetales bacterium]